MPTLLTDMVIDEVSLVDEPANEGARVLLWKRRPRPGDPTLDEEKTTVTNPQELALAVEIGKAASYARDDYYDALVRVAESLPGLPPTATPEARVAAALRTPLGKSLYAGYRAAPSGAPVAKRLSTRERQRAEELEARGEDTAYGRLARLAEAAHRKDPSRTFEDHLTEAVRDNPKDRERHRLEQFGRGR